MDPLLGFLFGVSPARRLRPFLGRISKAGNARALLATYPLLRTKQGEKNEEKRRDVMAIANRKLLPLYPMPQGEDDIKSNRLIGLLDVEDRRTFHPEGVSRSPMSVKGIPVRVRTITKVSGKSLPKGPIIRYFSRPDRIAICIRRKTRREVIHAKRIAGSKVKQGKRSVASSYWCLGLHKRFGYSTGYMQFAR